MNVALATEGTTPSKQRFFPQPLKPRERDFCGLEDESRGESKLVVIGVELRSRNLHAAPDRKAGSALRVAGTQLEFAEDDPRG